MIRVLFIWAMVLSLGSAALAQSDPETLFQDAQRFHAGDGVLQDYRRAAALFQQAADLGHAPSLNRLGQYHYEGRGVAQDRARGIDLLERAAAQGNPQFVFDLAQVLEQSAATQARAANLYSQAAAGGVIDAAVNLGVMYQEGIGIAKDADAARTLYEQAAAVGHPRALNNLGLLYTRADGVDQDYGRAAQLFAKAADTGLPQAMRNLATLYENGFGVPLDEARAQELNRAAAGITGPVRLTFVADPRLPQPDPGSDTISRLQAQARLGDPFAQFQIAFDTLTGPKRPFAEIQQAATYIQDLAAWGHGPSMFNLALLYQRGIAVPQDYVLAYAWMLQADARNVTQAGPILRQMEAALTAQQLNDAQTFAKTIWSPPLAKE